MVMSLAKSPSHVANVCRRAATLHAVVVEPKLYVDLWTATTLCRLPGQRPEAPAGPNVESLNFASTAYALNNRRAVVAASVMPAVSVLASESPFEWVNSLPLACDRPWDLRRRAKVGGGNSIDGETFYGDPHHGNRWSRNQEAAFLFLDA